MDLFKDTVWNTIASVRRKVLIFQVEFLIINIDFPLEYGLEKYGNNYI